MDEGGPPVIDPQICEFRAFDAGFGPSTVSFVPFNLVLDSEALFLRPRSVYQFQCIVGNHPLQKADLQCG